MKHFLTVEEKVADLLESYIKQEELRLQRVEDVISAMQRSVEVGAAHPGEYVGNPINAFLLVKRLTMDWEIMKGQLSVGSQFLEQGHVVLRDLPDTDQFKEAAGSIFQLQDMYDITPYQMVYGNIEGISETPDVDAEICLYLAIEAAKIAKYERCADWTNAGLSLVKPSERTTVVSTNLMDWAVYCLNMRGHYQQALDKAKEWLSYQPHNQRAMDFKVYLENTIGSEGPDVPQKQPELTEFFKTYAALCRGESQNLPRNPKCFYDKKHPFYILRPLKVEVLSYDPVVHYYHDFVVESEINIVKRLSSLILMRAAVEHPDGKHSPSKERVSSNAWLEASWHPKVRKIREKVQFATGLSLSTAEQIQVANYGIGGFYHPHFDYFLTDEVDYRGNRIATCLFYVSDVAAGGGTIFNHLNLTVWPENGGMVFWHNLLPSGKPDERMRHAACPVLTGSKWVLNLWVRELGEPFTRPCGLHPSDGYS